MCPLRCSFVLRVMIVLALLPVAALTARAGQTEATAELKADLERGQAALKAGDQTTAAQQFGEALKLDPVNVEAHANLGAIAFFHGDC